MIHIHIFSSELYWIHHTPTPDSIHGYTSVAFLGWEFTRDHSFDVVGQYVVGYSPYWQEKNDGILLVQIEFTQHGLFLYKHFHEWNLLLIFLYIKNETTFHQFLVMKFVFSFTKPQWAYDYGFDNIAITLRFQVILIRFWFS